MQHYRHRVSSERQTTFFQRQLPVYLGHPPLFSGVSHTDYSRITATARLREFERGEMLYLEGNPVKQVLLLTSGLVKVNQIGMGGMEVILGLGVPGDILGVAGLLTDNAHYTSAEAFRCCTALVWDAAAFGSTIERYPVVHRNMVRILANDVQELQERFREVATEKVGPRVARQLVRLREKIGKPVDGAVEIGVSREELAQMTGTNLFTVSRLLSAWEASGMVKPRREAVVICNLQSLREVSELPQAR